MGVVGDILAWAQRFDRENPCSQPRTCAPLERDAVLDALKCAAIIPFQVVYVVEGEQGGAVTLSHKEFRREEEAMTFYEQLGETGQKRVTRRGREVRKDMRAPGQAWPWKWVPDHPSSYQCLEDLLGEADAKRLGALASRVLVRFDPGMAASAHGCSERCPVTQVALCRVNPATPDFKYCILHEFMHHQLDWLGCPCLTCPQVLRSADGSVSLGGVRLPAGHYMQEINCKTDPNFFPNIVVKLWELIQHSRFNLHLRRDFACGPQQARDSQMLDLLTGRAQFPYCNLTTDPPSVRLVVMAFHFATALLESSDAVQQRMRTAILRAPLGEAIIDLGTTIRSHINDMPASVCAMDEEEAEAVMGAMLMDLEQVLQTLLLGAVQVSVGDVQSMEGGTLVLGRSKAVAVISISPAP